MTFFFLQPRCLHLLALSLPARPVPSLLPDFPVSFFSRVAVLVLRHNLEDSQLLDLPALAPPLPSSFFPPAPRTGIRRYLAPADSHLDDLPDGDQRSLGRNPNVPVLKLKPQP